MNVYLFGTPDYEKDSYSLEIGKKLSRDFKDINIVIVKPNQDLPFAGESKAVLIDTVEGIERVELIENHDIDKLVLSPRNSAHDYDLGFQLKYLKKIGKLNELYIIGIPMNGNTDYERIHSIFKKLVAQDMQGS